tara:strand:- start:6359 stop:8137 length:1779 start_codon:yes stop_codon:yes gene_type:complete
MIRKSTYQKILYIFNYIGYKKLLFILFLVLIGATLEVIGISSIGPFIAILINPNLIQENHILNLLYQNSPNYIKGNFINYFGFSLIIIFVIVNIFIAYLTYTIEKVSRQSTANLSIALLSKYISNSYTFIVEKNSNELVKNVIIEVQQVIHGILLPILQSVGKFFITLFICIFLFFINFKITAYLIIFLSIIFSLVFIFAKSKLRKLGIQRSLIDKFRFIVSNEAIGAIKEAKILNIENFFISKFSTASFNYAKVHVKVLVYTIFPKYFIELLIMITIICSLLLVSNNSNLISNLPILSIYIFAGYRILPGMHVLYASFSSVKKSEESLNIIYKDLFQNEKKYKSEISNEKIEFNHSIKLEKVCFNYQNKKNNIINNLSLKINKFDKIALFGQTGVGKSTFIDLITGLIDPKSGSILIDHLILNNKNKSSWFKQISYIPQSIFFTDASFSENIAIGEQEKNINYTKIEESMNIANINFVNPKSREELSKNIGEYGKNLSGGEKQRIGIARSIYSNRNILIFDEATNAIDNITEEKIISQLIKMKKTIFFITHNSRYLKNFDKVIFFDQYQKVYIDTYENLLNNEEFKNLQKN